jgi:hypothetical protein
MVPTAVIGRYTDSDEWATDIVKKLAKVTVDIEVGADSGQSGQSDIEIGISGATM